MNKVNKTILTDVAEYKINYDEIADIVSIMDYEFDSHQFINSFVKKYPTSYGYLLIKYDDVTSTHSQIANFLRNNAKDLQIEEDANKEKSNSIFGNEVPNAHWRKINK